MEEFSGVLSAYHSGPRRPTRETPFYPVHDAESIIPIEYSVQILRMMRAHENDQSSYDSLDFKEEKREQALVRLSQYWQFVAWFYNKNVNSRRINVGDLVLRKVFWNIDEANAENLAAIWECLYRVIHIVYSIFYKLKILSGMPDLRSLHLTIWKSNITDLGT